VRDLTDTVLAALTDEPARVAVQMMQQLLRGAAVRAAHEIAWMHEEIDDIITTVDALAGADAPAGADADPLAAARTVLDELDASSLHLADVQQRYDRAGEVLSCAIEAAYVSGDTDAIEKLRAVLQRRSEHEMAIIGQFDLVGRG
jgi:hypothetical protein